LEDFQSHLCVCGPICNERSIDQCKAQDLAAFGFKHREHVLRRTAQINAFPDAQVFVVYQPGVRWLVIAGYAGGDLMTIVPEKPCEILIENMTPNLGGAPGCWV